MTQREPEPSSDAERLELAEVGAADLPLLERFVRAYYPVSYTHLTLPTT